MKKIKFAAFKSFMKGRGFIGALCLSVVAVAIATYVAYDSTLREITSQQSFNTEQVNNPVSGVPKEESSTDETSEDKDAVIQDNSSDTSDNKDSVPPPEDEPTNNFISTPSARMMPVEGEIINPYSGGELVKSETLGVWKTHDGIDIACDEGSSVKAAAAGKVTQIRNDPLWGVCVVIDHYDGYQGFYYGLDKQLEVNEQQEIDAGEIIGKTAPFDCESKLPPHLHFGMKFSDKWIDPAEFIG
ncbi:MAG: M23 family metallopeptidase [Eubacterium sp.]|nr:M23 family metallopeptidase [Eubacterium sp.]